MKRDFEDVRLGSIEPFCRAAESSSFTAAAQIAGVTPAGVSRSISRLEERLGSRLFVRPPEVSASPTAAVPSSSNGARP